MPTSRGPAGTVVCRFASRLPFLNLVKFCPAPEVSIRINRHN
ncbi:hypothetical protein FOXG_19072 [Fusarium oxysporum f. sp. lycopersici 4287]|uniref:Uncharacterized protein n=2 Tax=Fusarium oxysporum TaxID=5507 RepID=A0A0J9WKX8_FUSO4|nr:hypothetical protein FOXG_19072 [Fusarium oxysporum f. sp. lycopersici 4287]EXK39765.1 hypothetical protein FOMG_06933 [Fusarium oxysporum f. sp. melonis 26406]KNB02807.1 hypothetical protein FOXG_19072 [Fusarium oxysporum f. sp. lycopersici 4287]